VFSQSGLQSYKKAHHLSIKESWNNSVAQANNLSPNFMKRMIKASNLNSNSKRVFPALMTFLFTHLRRTIRIRYLKSLNAIALKYFKLKIRAKLAAIQNI